MKTPNGHPAVHDRPRAALLVKLVEARSMALITEMYLKASLMRKESRSGHYREDFPERHGDPAWIVIRDGHDGMDLRADPVPPGPLSGKTAPLLYG